MLGSAGVAVCGGLVSMDSNRVFLVRLMKTHEEHEIKWPDMPGVRNVSSRIRETPRSLRECLRFKHPFFCQTSAQDDHQELDR